MERCSPPPKSSDGSDIQAGSNPRSSQPQPVPAKEPSLLSRLCQTAQSLTDGTSSVEHEVNSYLQTPPSSSKTYPLTWWKDNAASFPNLARLALRYLSVPATSTSSERAYSAAGILTTGRRGALSSENVDRLVFLNKNTDFGRQMAEEVETEPLEDSGVLPSLPQT